MDAVHHVSSDFASWKQSLRCAERNDAMQNFTEPSRQHWREPAHPNLCCVRRLGASGCFRGAFDGRVEIENVDEELREDRPATKAARERMNEQIMRVMASEFGVEAWSVEPSVSRWLTYQPKAIGFSSPTWKELHADYFESDQYVFSAVLYLGEEDDDAIGRVGGQTGLADEFWPPPPPAASNLFGLWPNSSGTVHLKRGALIEPKRGRLLLFSSGGENWHSPLAVTRGRRSTYHAWFKCHPECEDRARKEQREQRERQREL